MIPTEQYQFTKNNPYANTKGNLIKVAFELIKQGQTLNAIKAMEAQISKDPTNKLNGNIWRIVGKLH